jgi:hypothetical protein
LDALDYPLVKHSGNNFEYTEIAIINRH